MTKKKSSLVVLATVATALVAAGFVHADTMVTSPDYAVRWWNSLSPEQMVAALHGDMATDEQAAAAKKMHADLDFATTYHVDLAATKINGHLSFDSVGAWWESLNCQLMRIAAGDGNTADSMSAFCAHYPGSDHEKILGEEALAHVHKVGMALLGRTDPGMYEAPAADSSM
ncbi:MAG: hypothetical protein OXP69_13765 [Spirochaetaceae bacterium]|nr:hypothetical protein [Spirochaetaceae bacterium]